MKICICGGGNLGHTLAGVFAQKADVCLLTRHPEKWSNEITVYDSTKTIVGKLGEITDNPNIVSSCDMVILCLPGFAIREELLKIKPYLKPETTVGTVVSSTGFFFEAMEVLPDTTPLFGFQRVPYIARVREYGKSVDLLGHKDSLNLAVEHSNDKDKENIRQVLENLTDTPTKLLKNYLEASLTNSNPLLHTSRMYAMWHDWKPGIAYPEQNLFYEDWDISSAELLIAMDNEFQELLKVLPVTPGCIPSILEYYESSDAESLARKIRSISAFKGIKSPMVQTDKGWIPDITSRYFTEDFMFGLSRIVKLIHEKNINSHNIDKVYEWGNRMIRANEK